MKLIKTTLMMTLSGLLVACGGGGSDGYYQNTPGNQNTTPVPGDNTSIQEQQEIFNSLKTEAASLFGQGNPEKKGYIDHALDTYAQSILKISQDIRSVNFSSFENTHRKAKCFEKSVTDFRACYVFKGNEIKQLLGSNYDDWDFEIDKGFDYDDLANIRLKSDEIMPDLNSYYGQTYLLIFENENPLKNLQDITIAGAFSYPFKQSQGLQKRFILINQNTSDFKIEVTKRIAKEITNEDGSTDTTLEDEITTMGALSIYKVPRTLDESEYYVTEAGSGFNTLINDNTNVAYAEPINFRIDSTHGIAPSTYKILNGIEILNLPSITIAGTRVEHEAPSLNDKEFIGSIYLQGPNILDFKQSALNSVLKFKHIFNEITYEGQSLNTNSGIVTTITSPQNIKY
ncbi:hypothetical protein [Acinetobacter variabilis]|uniref:hypothetical protein n=1 Tax=Acinetobacter variabilis TaxID=70346 RepID=UPI003D770232